jgi:hypothetical protein
MSEEEREALVELIGAAFAWHDVDFGQPGELEAELNLSATLNSYRGELERLLASLNRQKGRQNAETGILPPAE